MPAEVPNLGEFDSESRLRKVVSKTRPSQSWWGLLKFGILAFVAGQIVE